MLAQGKNPYELIGPGRTYPHDWPLVYPATAAVAALPFAWASARVADALFVGFGAAVLAWALTRRTLANPQLWVFASYAMLVSAQTVQWSPLLTAAALIPWLGFLFAAKPTIGFAMFIAYPSRAAFYGMAAFGALTIAIWPYWVPAWIHNLPSITHMSAPVARLGGPLILLALLKWRRADARLLAGLACVPHTPVLYEALPLFLLVRNFREATLLVVLSGVLGRIVLTTVTTTDYHTWMAINGRLMVWLLYLPCTAMILARPNEGLTLDWRAMLAKRWSRDRDRSTPKAA